MINRDSWRSRGAWSREKVEGGAAYTHTRERETRNLRFESNVDCER